MGKRVFASLIATEKATAPGDTLELIPNVLSSVVPNVPGLSVIPEFISKDLENRIIMYDFQYDKNILQNACCGDHETFYGTVSYLHRNLSMQYGMLASE